MPLVRHIVHVNITGFYAQLARIQNPSLDKKPFVIGFPDVPRAVVMDVSPAAFAEGLTRGMPLEAARRRVPGLTIICPPEEGARKVMQAMAELASSTCPGVELGSRAHLYLDLSGTRRLLGHAVDAAARLQKAITCRTGLLPSCALASSKLVARVATRVIRPVGFAAITPGSEVDFLHPQPVSLLPGAPNALVERLKMLGIDTAGQLAALEESLVRATLGPTGVRLRQAALGLDETPVGLPLEARLTETRLLQPDSCDPAELRAHLLHLVESLGFLLRRQNRAAGHAWLAVSGTDTKEHRRQTTLRAPLWLDNELFAAVNPLLERACPPRLRIRCMTLSLGSLCAPVRQLDLFQPPPRENLQNALDDLRSRHGFDIVARANRPGTPNRG